MVLPAEEGVDYVAADGDLMFADGDSEVKVNVTLMDDVQMEAAEMFTLVLGDTQGRVI